MLWLPGYLLGLALHPCIFDRSCSLWVFETCCENKCFVLEFDNYFDVNKFSFCLCKLYFLT